MSTLEKSGETVSPAYAGAIVRYNLTIGKRTVDSPMGLALIEPTMFQNHETLNLVGLTWSCEGDEARAIRNDLNLAREALPAAHFVILTNTEAESWFLSRLGVLNRPGIAGGLLA